MALALSKILLIAGASVAGSILVKNGSFSDFLNDSYKVLTKHLKGNNESSKQTNVDVNLLAQLRQELSALASERASITVVTTGSKPTGVVVSVTIPVLLAGATGYAYLRWKGYSFSDFMYVTKRGMSDAVASVSKQLEQVTTALSAAKRHLSSRIDHLSTTLDDNTELQGELKHEVLELRGDLARYGLEIETVQKIVQALGSKIDSIENKQDVANSGVKYLCDFVEVMQNFQQRESLQGFHRPRLERASASFNGLKELQSISYTLQSSESSTAINVKVQEDGASSSGSSDLRSQKSSGTSWAPFILKK